MKRLWQSSAPARWLRTLLGLARGVRIHPSVRVQGASQAVTWGRGASIGEGCVLRADGAGRISIAEGVWLARDVEMETETRVMIGAGTTLQRRSTVNGTTRIGRQCILAPDVFISSGTHPFRQIPHLPIREQERRLAAQGVSLDRAVWIQDDCWLGTHAVVCPGVTIGKGSVIGANSVVTRDVPPYSVVAGSPARVIGQRLDWSPPLRVDPAVDTDWVYVLSGVPATDGTPGLIADAGAPIVVALRAPGAGEVARIRVHCGAAARLRVNRQDQALDAGAHSILVPAARGEVLGATIRIEVEADVSALIVFTLFEIVSSS
jgi:acetyltransferase-like isoleucine patch superfamily enzyme